MATLVLTAVGTAIAGPIGGMIGGMAGQAIDAQWLTPGGRRGPRPSDLRVQTSSYGTPIPRLYGLMRVAGTVIWSTDLIEQRQRRGNGKGQPKTTTYSYSASFAVALSSRPIIGVRRIWADGTILRGADGHFVEQTGFRLHPGDADQAVDPFIAAAEGPDAAPAYRGIAYAMFEAMDLSAFGNRLPSLTFEVEADTGPVPLGLPAAEMLDAPLLATGPTVRGYALGGASRRDAVSELAPLLPLARVPGSGWRIADAGSSTAALPEPGTATGSAAPERRTAAADRLPRALHVLHFDPARDFQSGTQMAMLPGGKGAAVTRDLPVAADAATARALAMREAVRLRAAQQTQSWPGGLAGLATGPGAAVRADGAAMRVDARRIEGGVAVLELSRQPELMVAPAAADGGRAVTAPDQPTGETVAALFDLPAILPADVDEPRLMLAASGTGAGWRRASVTLIAASGGAEADIGTVAAAAAFGHVVGVSGAATALLFDDAGWIDVALARADMQLSNAADADLLAGANLMAAGTEIFQFGLAEPLPAPGHWRLRRLLRGRWGSDAGVAAGDACVRLDDPALMPVGDAVRAAQPGGAVIIGATGAASAQTLPISTAGRALRPLAPAHLSARWADDGGLTLGWIRRSRTGFDWRDGVDAPLDAASEAYRLDLTVGADTIQIDLAAATHHIDSAQIALWRSGGVTVLGVAIAQIGRLGPSDPVTTTIAL